MFGLECDIAKTRKLAQDAKGANELFECKTFANDLKAKMQKNGIKGEEITVKTPSAEGKAGNIWSDNFKRNISTNGEHKAIQVGDTVFDNLNPNGVKVSNWEADLFSVYGHSTSRTPF